MVNRNKNNTNSRLKTKTEETILIIITRSAQIINLIKPRELDILTKRVISRINKVLINRTHSSMVIVSLRTRIVTTVIMHSYYSSSSSITIWLTNKTTRSNLILNWNRRSVSWVIAWAFSKRVWKSCSDNKRRASCSCSKQSGWNSISSRRASRHRYNSSCRHSLLCRYFSYKSNNSSNKLHRYLIILFNFNSSMIQSMCLAPCSSSSSRQVNNTATT